MSDIRYLHWKDFEWFCKYLLEHLGYERISVTSKDSHVSDGGIDITCYKDQEKVLGQCKQWKNGSHGFLPSRVVMEHAGYMKLHNAKSGILLTTLDMSSMDYEAAKKLDIKLIGKREIVETMKRLNPAFVTE